MHRPAARAGLSALAAIALVLSPLRIAGQGATVVTADARWQRAVDAWAAGHYPDALQDLGALVRSTDAAAYRDRIALLTGELFTTIELTTDGRNPRLSADGQLALYDTGPAESSVTRLVRVGDGTSQTIAEFAGVSATFNATASTIVYLRRPHTSDWTNAIHAYTESKTAAARQAAQAGVNFVLGGSDLVIRDTSSGAEQVWPTPDLVKMSPVFAADGHHVLVIGAHVSDLSRTDIYEVSKDAAPRALTDQPGYKTGILVDPTGAALVYSVTAVAPFLKPGSAIPHAGAAAANGCSAGVQTPPSFAVVDLAQHTTRAVEGSAVAMSADGSTLAWLARDGTMCSVKRAATLSDSAATVISAARLDAPALSPDGRLVAYQLMTNTDWDIYQSDSTGASHRVTRDTRHDVLPRFLTPTTLLAMAGEPRDRRSYLYDLSAGTRTRLFANNTIRTISPEYVWVPSADGRRIIVQAERDGDTVSPERGVYVIDLERKVSVAGLSARIDRQLSDETDLRTRMTAAFRPIASLVTDVVGRAAINRIYDYERALVDLDSKYVSEPGNALAIAYVEQTYRSFGYEPVLQWFTPAEARGRRTANVIAIKRGTENPDVMYVVSSHFDSVLAGPGADDDVSGTAALFETARILKDVPLAATVVFASFTGEEAGLLGSQEFVRRAADAHWHVAGALNNDMIGWSADSFRLDNTIRYSNAGIRDIQHGAAFLFTDLITYDAKYYKSTDAQAFFDAWGDIVGGLGPYPVLANPNYHQASDLIETVNFQQVTETAKATAATLIYLASSPSRLKDLKARKSAGGVDVTWNASPEAGVDRYVVAYGPATDPLQTRVTASSPHVRLPALAAGTTIAVKAVNNHDLEGWDWARIVLE